VPLLFGVITKSEPLWLITKFHGRKHRSLNLSSATKKRKKEKKLSGQTWLARCVNESHRNARAHTFKSEQRRARGTRERVSKPSNYRFWQSTLRVGYKACGGCNNFQKRGVPEALASYRNRNRVWNWDAKL